jgi:class 3 adenylate cyclase
MADVFISYARSTATQAAMASEALRRGGYSVWLDDELLAHGSFADAIEQQLDAAAVVLVLWSVAAAGSMWVRAEASRARKSAKLVQVKLDETSLPMPFDQLHCAKLIGWTGDPGDPAWLRVMSAIEERASGRRGADGPRSEARAASAPAGVPSPTQRRRLTILSCGLVDGASIAARFDPEDWQAVSRRQQHAATNAIVALGGHVERFADGLVGYFGYPVAQEYAAERAVRAGLAIHAAIADLNESLERDFGVAIRVRVGVHAGLVVVGQDAAGAMEIFGDAVTVAAELQAATPPGAVLITSAVHDVISGLFVVEPVELPTTGAAGTLGPVFQVLSSGGGGGTRRSRGFAARERTAFVGRDDETFILASRWRRVRDGEGQLVLLTGEPGIGKTRLTEEFRASLGGDPHLWLECGGGPLYVNTTFHAVTQVLHDALGPDEAGGPDRTARLENSLRSAGLDPDDSLPLFADLLQLPLPEGSRPTAAAPEQKRIQLLAALVGWIFGASRAQPLVLAVEDLHWIDPSTMELIRTLADQCATAPMMVLCTARPEFQAPWPHRAHHSHITLNRLNSAQTRQLVVATTARAGLGAEVVEAVIRRTDGVPLFAEEVSRLIVEGGGKLGARDVPATLVDSLAARLDRLGSAKAVAQLGSVIGREFSYALLRILSPLPDADLRADLARLADAELLNVRGLPPDATYQFKHALLLDAAYGALLRSQRRELHANVARAVTEQFPALAESHPEVLASHWREAGEDERAVAAWTEAARRAAARAAHVEAAGYLRAALDLVRRRPAGSERAMAELPLLTALATSLAPSIGYSVPEVQQALGEARVICEALGDMSGLYAVLINMSNTLATAGDLSAAEAAARRCDEISLRTGAPAQRIQAEFMVGCMLYLKGELAEARRRLENSIRLNVAHDGGALTFFTPTSPLVESLAALPIVLHALGETTAAAARAEDLLREARASARPYDLAYALGFRGVYDMVAACWGDLAGHSDEALALCEANGFATYRAVAMTMRALATGHLGAAAEGLRLFEVALAEMKRLGVLRALGLFVGEAARLHLMSGDPVTALAKVDEAIELAGRSYRINLARLHHLRADILAAPPVADPIAAAAAREEAVVVARSQGAVGFERAAGGA